MPVIFDFKGLESEDDRQNKRSYLYCLFPNKNRLDATVAWISRKAFISSAANGEWTSWVRHFIEELNQKKRNQEADRQQQQQQNIITERFFTPQRYRRRRF